MTRAAWVASVVVWLVGCHPHLAPPDVPAVLTNPTAESRAELAGAVSRALNGAPVTIADSALTADDVLIVERAPRRDARGLEIDGRVNGRPERFRLLKSGSRCVLVHEGSGQRWPLESATCSPR